MRRALSPLPPHPLEAARAFSDHCQALDRRLRRENRQANPADQIATARALWAVSDALDAAPGDGWPPALAPRLRAALGGWLWRSRVWNRATFKPHGYAGDYQMLEWMYDLEGNPCQDPTQPAIANCLDYAMTTLHCVVGLWHRRRTYRRLLETERQRTGGRLKVLDVACGGARYIRDFLEGLEDTSGTSGVEITLIDQDASALVYAHTRALAPWSGRVRTLCLPIRRIPQVLREGGYDVVLSTGLYDYLDDDSALGLSAHLAGLLAPGGVLALSNYALTDPSDTIRRWVTDWALICRDRAGLVGVFPEGLEVLGSESPEGSLVYGVGRKVG